MSERKKRWEDHVLLTDDKLPKIRQALYNKTCIAILGAEHLRKGGGQA